MKASLQSVQDELKPQAIQHVGQNGLLTVKKDPVNDWRWSTCE